MTATMNKKNEEKGRDRTLSGSLPGKKKRDLKKKKTFRGPVWEMRHLNEIERENRESREEVVVNEITREHFPKQKDTRF